MIPFERPAWQADAACRGLGPDKFYVDRGESTAEAKAVCASCPVHAQCEAFSIDERFGIWASQSERQRRTVRAQQPRTRGGRRHGTRSAYNEGCRCGPCVADNTAYDAARRAEHDAGHELPRGSVPYTILSRMSQDGAA